MNDITPTTSPRSIAVLGLGSMGSGIARNLATAGHHVTVWNRTATRAGEFAETVGVEVAATPGAAAADADVVIAMVRDDEASSDVWLGPDGAAAALAADAVAIESSTITPAWAVELDHAITSAGVGFLEAPVVGSRPQLAQGALVSLIGGDAQTMERVRDVLEVSSGAIRHCGPVGSAAVAKLAVNGLFATQVAAFAETVGFLHRSGMAVDDATGFLTALPITSPALQRILGLFAASDYAPNFPIELVAKDLDYLNRAGARVGAATPVAAAVADAFGQAVDAGDGGLDIAGLGRRHF